MVSSKIGQKDSWKVDRLDTKEEYIENLILNIECLVNEKEGYVLKTDTQIAMFKTLIGCDSEMYHNLGGFNDNSNVEWYKEHIRKQLNKLDTTALAFLTNTISLIGQ